MTSAICKEQMMLCRSRGTRGAIQEVEYHEAWQRARQEAAYRALLQGLIKMKPFKSLSEVVDWLHQRASKYGHGTRFKFLVANGPSRYGKTQWAKALYGVDNTLVIPCQGVLQPNLKELCRTRARAIVFDEASPQMVVANKALFQAGIDPVLLAQSKCNDYAYSVFVYGMPMVVCTNDWDIGVSPHDREWLDKNSVVIQVTEPLWEEHEPLQM